MKIVYNASYGGLCLSDAAMERLAELHREAGIPWDGGDLPRHHPMLVRVVEELGKDAGGGHSEPRVTEIFEDRYFIRDYNGKERVVTPSSVHWTETKAKLSICGLRFEDLGDEEVGVPMNEAFVALKTDGGGSFVNICATTAGDGWEASIEDECPEACELLRKMLPDVPDGERLLKAARDFWVIDRYCNTRKEGPAVLCELEFANGERRWEIFPFDGPSPELAADAGLWRGYSGYRGNIKIARVIGTFDTAYSDIAWTLKLEREKAMQAPQAPAM